MYSAAHRRKSVCASNSLSSPGIITIAPAPLTKSKGYIIGAENISYTRRELMLPPYSEIIFMVVIFFLTVGAILNNYI